MLNRIFNYESKSEPVADCYQCRMIGGGGLLGIGGYIIYYSFSKRNSANKLAIFASSFLGSVVMTLGIFRFTGIDDLYRPRSLKEETNQSPMANDPELLKE